MPFLTVLSSSTQISESKDSSSWYLNEAIKHRVATNALMPKQMLPLNSLDVIGRSLVVAGDNESFYLLRNLLL